MRDVSSRVLCWHRCKCSTKAIGAAPSESLNVALTSRPLGWVPTRGIRDRKRLDVVPNVPEDRTGLSRGLLFALGYIAAVGPLSIDMYLASFTDIAVSLDTTAAAVQLTLTTFLVGLGFGQLILGPLSDRHGRRTVLISALIVFTLSGAAMVFAPNIGVLVALRAVQGFTGAAGIVIARAIAADLTTGTGTVRALSLIATLVGLGPLLAPPIGGAVSTLWGWRGVLVVLAVAATVMLLVSILVVPESLPAQNRLSRGLGSTFRTMGTLVRDLSFVLYTLAFAFGFAVMIAYISASPFVGQGILNMSPIAYSLAFATSATALLLAGLTNARLAPRFGPQRMLLVGTSALLAGSVAMATFIATGALTPASFIVCAFATTGGAGFTMTNSSALALNRAAHARGSGSALLGTTQFLLGGLFTPVVGLWGEHTALPLAVVMTSTAAIALTLALLARRVPS